MVTDEQVRLLRNKRMEGKTLVAAAAVAGMSERSARKWQRGELPMERKRARDWRTRPDAFEEVWDSELVPLLARDERRVLEARTVLEELERRHPQRFSESHLRTLQRRMRQWRALHGPEREVFFEQEHVAGREGAFDFTDCRELEVRICGELFEHRLFEFVLSYSGWTWSCLAYSETFEALSEGLQGALWALGGVPEVVRSDNLSAATHELKQTGGRGLTARYQGLVEHYGMKSTRIRPGQSHENGVVEQKHGRIKSLLAQALVIRGHKDFANEVEYATFVAQVVERSNRLREVKLSEEKQRLRALPATRLPAYTLLHPHVTRWCTVRVARRTYSVPSRLIGHEVEVRLYATVVELRYAGQVVETMPRLRGGRTARIDYRHVIWSLVKKPGAFARYRYREELFPTLVFRCAYDALRERLGERADVEYVRILHLAASTLERRVEQALEQLLAQGQAFDYACVNKLAAPPPSSVPQLTMPTPDLTHYDRLLSVLGGAA